jgi:putative nucleotidyltransferase with HDIG domain
MREEGNRMEGSSRILIVDDEPQILSLLEEFLTNLEYTVRAVADVEHALQLLQRESFDGVVTDLKMPKLGGLELLRAIKRSHPLLPVIMMTGYPSVETAVGAMKEGAADFITKPLQLDELKLALNKITKNRRAEHLGPANLPDPSALNPGASSPLHGKIKELSMLYAISEAFQTVTDTEAIFQRLVEVAREIVGAQCASFMVLDPEAKGASLKKLQAHAADPLRRTQTLLDDRMLGQLIQERKPLLFTQGEPGIVIPVLIKNELLGVLSVWEKEDHLPFTEDEILLLLTLCRKAALSIENQCLYESLYQSLLETLKALVTTLEARDPYTRAHSQRVSHYATALAAKMGCGQEEQDIVKVAGYLHDIGKVGICDAILLKAGPLTPVEYEIVKTHPVIGEQIVQNLGYFTREKSIIRHHHKWWDGRGYPDGLKEHHIPFLTRILTVADAFDAMTSNRPYRRARSCKQALEELEGWAGIQFDTEVVVAFQHVIGKDQPAILLVS